MSRTTIRQNGRRQNQSRLSSQNLQRQNDEGVRKDESHRREDEHPLTHALPVSDFPKPQVLTDTEPFFWMNDAPPVEKYIKLAHRLAEGGDLFRNPQHGAGLLLASSCALIQPKPIEKGADLAPVIADRVRICVIKRGDVTGSMPASADLNAMLKAEIFLQQFQPIDQVVTVPMYLPNFELTRPGYNDGGLGSRIYYVGKPADFETNCEAISKFLDVMEFASEADRTNAVGAALTAKLRNHWPGSKPMIAVTSSKSHGGKDTVIEFAAGRTPRASISYELQDWALHKNFAAMVHHNPEIGMINIENVRLHGKDELLASCFLERFLTDPEPVIFSTGTGSPKRRKNDLVVAMSTNFGKISEDLLNRSLPIRLEPVGDVASRRSPIGNPKLKFLPENRERIEAELRGMIEKWKEAGRPLDETREHTFTDWSQTIGGILKLAGFEHFLENYGTRKTQDDPVRLALGLMGISCPDTWLRSEDWVLTCQENGLIKRLIYDADRESMESRKRFLGIVLSAHRDETFEVETEDDIVVLQLKKARRRFNYGKPTTRYQFIVRDRQPIPEDDLSENESKDIETEPKLPNPKKDE